jgi:hypothetical protein
MHFRVNDLTIRQHFLEFLRILRRSQVLIDDDLHVLGHAGHTLFSEPAHRIPALHVKDLTLGIRRSGPDDFLDEGGFGRGAGPRIG